MELDRAIALSLLGAIVLRHCWLMASVISISPARMRRIGHRGCGTARVRLAERTRAGENPFCESLAGKRSPACNIPGDQRPHAAPTGLAPTFGRLLAVNRGLK